MALVNKLFQNCFNYTGDTIYKTFTIDDLVNIFPIGFPSNDELKKVWDMQKIIRPSMEYSDNLLDYKEAGKSMF